MIFREYGPQRVHRDPPGTDFFDGMFDSGNQSLEIVIASDNFLMIRVIGGINKCPFALFLPLTDVPPQPIHVSSNIFGRLFKGNKDAVFTIRLYPLSKELSSHNGLGLPAVPATRVVRPFGSPPNDIRSKPGIPARSFSIPLCPSPFFMMTLLRRNSQRARYQAHPGP